jgi:hypothetical protein
VSSTSTFLGASRPALELFPEGVMTGVETEEGIRIWVGEEFGRHTQTLVIAIIIDGSIIISYSRRWRNSLVDPEHTKLVDEHGLTCGRLTDNEECCQAMRLIV